MFDTALIKALIALFAELGLDGFNVDHLEEFETWSRSLTNLELAALTEFFARRLARRFEEAK